MWYKSRKGMEAQDELTIGGVQKEFTAIKTQLNAVQARVEWIEKGEEGRRRQERKDAMTARGCLDPEAALVLMEAMKVSSETGWAYTSVGAPVPGTEAYLREYHPCLFKKGPK